MNGDSPTTLSKDLSNGWVRTDLGTLPLKGERVLAGFKDWAGEFTMVIAFVDEPEHITDERGKRVWYTPWYNEDEYEIEERVTHWMPLPEKPHGY